MTVLLLGNMYIPKKRKYVPLFTVPGPSQSHNVPGTPAGQETGTCMNACALNVALYTKLSLANREFSFQSI